ncbi:ATP-citrate synthase subunit 1 [Schizophyllum commune]
MNTADSSASIGEVNSGGERTHAGDNIIPFESGKAGTRLWYRPFDERMRSFVYGVLDFSYSCGRDTPSVAAMIYPFDGYHIQKFYWGTRETLLLVYKSVEEAVKKHPDVVLNFASSRSVYILTLECFKSTPTRSRQSRSRQSRSSPRVCPSGTLARSSILRQKGVLIIGLATVGGVKSGCFRIGNCGGMLDNIIVSKLYRPGSVGYVSKSGRMLNELNNMLSLFTNSTYENIAIGGDRYPGSTFIDHLNCKMLVLLGVEEYPVVEDVKQGKITKPIFAWAIGRCVKMFTMEVQLGHAGSIANSELETADTKNRIMREAGFLVLDTSEELLQLLKSTYETLVKKGTITSKPERDPPIIPTDYKWAQELGLVRKPAAFLSTISDERGQELLYAGMHILGVFKEDIGVSARRLPPWATKLIEMVLMHTADHGPTLSGAMNTISGLLTIGSRFGGALDEVAAMFSNARDTGLTPREFVENSRKANKLKLVKEYVRKNFPSHSLRDYALAVEKVTTSKKDTLILNVTGCIAVCFVDFLRDPGTFTLEEADEYIKIGTLDGLFVFSRSISLISRPTVRIRVSARRWTTWATTAASSTTTTASSFVVRRWR